MLSGGDFDADQRHAVTRELGFAETVFVDDIEAAAISIESLVGPIPFAGTPVLGAVWLLGQVTGQLPSQITLSAGDVACWQEGQDIWVDAQLRWLPAWWHEHVNSPEQLRQSEPRLPEQDAVQLWTWTDEPAGTVFARTFASRFDLSEVQACGSACMQLAATLGRDLTVTHGAGSRILARPGQPGHAHIGGRIVDDGVRTLSL